MRLRSTNALGNRICDLAYWFEDRGHDGAAHRIQRFRWALNRAECRIFGHSRLIFGPMRDICLDCLQIVDEHPEGRR